MFDSDSNLIPIPFKSGMILESILILESESCITDWGQKAKASLKFRRSVLEGHYDNARLFHAPSAMLGEVLL